jgi:hypothetical protein
MIAPPAVSTYPLIPKTTAWLRPGQFCHATSLRTVRLETMKGIRDLRPLTTAPALRTVELMDMRHLQPTDLAPLIGLPHLTAVTPGLGSRRKNDVAAALLGLPPVRQPDDWRTPWMGSA